jgi:hypothetical protein
MKQYTFNKTDSGIFGKAFEMAIKDALNRKNADRVSPCGQSDFIINHLHYEVKQNGSCIQYHAGEKMMKGSNRVIYATHIAYVITAETEEEITLCIDLGNTDMFVLDRSAFLGFLETVNGVKYNASRGTANIQTCYNYKKDAYHGRLGRKIEEWAYENEIEDDIIGMIIEGLE